MQRIEAMVRTGINDLGFVRVIVWKSEPIK